MSVQAIAWALEQQEVRDPLTQLVLMCLANYADAVGKNAFPSISRLCRDSRLSESSVRRHLKQLESMALIIKGNQAIAAAQIKRIGYRPTVYDLALPFRGFSETPLRGVTQTPQGSGGVSGVALRGVTEGLEGCQSLTPDPKRSVREPKRALQSFEEEFRSRFGYRPREIPTQKGSNRGLPPTTPVGSTAPQSEQSAPGESSRIGENAP